MPRDFGHITQRPSLCQQFTIIRTTGKFAAGGWQASTPTNINANGIIVPADDEALAQVPEGDRVAGSLQAICNQPLYETQESRGAISDKIAWRGNIYKLLSVARWDDYGYWSAILVRMTGA